MKISVVIPVYNVEKYLRQCIDSIQNQTFLEYEVICINDGSVDSSGKLLMEYAYGNPVIKVIEQQNQGLSAARNAGIMAAEGDYILFLDSDDWIEPNALEILSKSISGEDLICFSGRRYIEEFDGYEPGDVLEAKEYESGWQYYCENALVHRNFAFVCTVLRAYRREYLINNNLYFKPGIKHEDNLFTPLACYYAGRTKVIPNVLYNYRIRSGSIMTTRSNQNKIDMISIANDLADFFAEKGIDKKTVFQAITHYYQTSLRNCSKCKDQEIMRTVKWESYQMVSRTKFRHRIQFWAMRISPALFRVVNSL